MEDGEGTNEKRHCTLAVLSQFVTSAKYSEMRTMAFVLPFLAVRILHRTSNRLQLVLERRMYLVRSESSCARSLRVVVVLREL